MLRIVAREARHGRFHARGQQTGKPGEAAPAATHEGTGVGLANVCERLRARFGTPRSANLVR